MLEIRPHVSYNGYWDFDGFQETGFLHLDTHWEWRSSYEFHTGVNFTREGVKEAFEIYPDIYVSPGSYDNAELSWSYNDIDLPEGAFEANLGRLRLSYSFTTLINLQALIQYNDRDDLWAANLRFAWLRTANSGLYVVYNEIQDLNGRGLGKADRSLIVKFTYLFDLL